MIFDPTCDDFTRCCHWRKVARKRQVLKNRHLPRLRKGGFAGGCFVIWVDPPYDKITMQKRTTQILDAISAGNDEIAEAVIVHNIAEVEQAKADGKFYILLGAEGFTWIGEDVTR